MKFFLRFTSTLLILLAAVAGLIYLYSQSQQFAIDEEQTLITELNSLTLKDVRWSTEILRVNAGISNNYDALNEYERAVVSQLETIRSLPNPSLPFGQLADRINEKISLTSQFKAESAILKNSLEYMNFAYEDLLFIQNQMPKEVIEISRELLSLIFSYNQNFSEEKEYIIITKIITLSALANLNDIDPKIKESINFYVAHLQVILTKRPNINTLLESIQGIDVERPNALLRQNLLEIIDFKAEEQRQSYEFMTYYAIILLGFLVLIGIRLLLSFIALHKSNKQLKVLNDRLEQRVEERTQELRQAIDDLKNSETHLIQAEKMSSLGQLVAGVVHEINTPLAYVKSSIETIKMNLFNSSFLQFVSHSEKMGNLLMKRKNQRTEEDRANIIKSLREVAIAIAQMKKAGSSFEELLMEMETLFDDSEYGADQISELISNLKNFSRLDRSRIAKYNLREAIESTLLLLKHEVKNKTIKKYLDENITVQCMPSQINQVLLNLINNANQAIQSVSNGKIEIYLCRVSDYAVIEVVDNGPGIPKEHIKSIFDPFFTTKEIGKGTGLGLSICYKIIQEHNGSIDVESTEGEGARFIIKLPLEVELDSNFFPDMQ